MQTNREYYGFGPGDDNPGAAADNDPECCAIDCRVCRHNNHYREEQFSTCDESWLAAPYGQPLDIREPWTPEPVTPPAPEKDPNPL